MTNEDAIAFTKHHLAVWNSHKLDEIIDLYSDDVELHSPVAAKITNGDCVRGKENLRAYFSTALDKYPELQFKLVNALLCVDTVTIYMQGVNDSLTAEVLFLDDNRKIKKVLAHYQC